MSPGKRAPARGAASEHIDSGTNGLAKERVADIQRSRMLTAAADVMAERGAANVTVAHVVARSGVSRRTFYEIFEDRQDCLLATFEDRVARVAATVGPAYGAGKGWAERIRLGLVALLACLDLEPALGRLLLVESQGAGLAVLERRAQVIALLTAVIDLGRAEGKVAETPRLTAEGTVGAVLSILHARLLSCERPLIELVNPLMSMVVLPYLGPAAARRELERPAPSTPLELGANGVGDPLRDLGMRLTYRTGRVVLSIAASPASSNREIGLAAGISDQGQISKLLTRLERFGLARNTGRAPGKGAPNAWTLTAKGWEVERVLA